MSDIDHDLFDCRKEQDQRFTDMLKHNVRTNIVSLGIVISIFMGITGFMAHKLDKIETLSTQTAVKVEMILQNGHGSK